MLIEIQDSGTVIAVTSNHKSRDEMSNSPLDTLPFPHGSLNKIVHARRSSRFKLNTGGCSWVGRSVVAVSMIQARSKKHTTYVVNHKKNASDDKISCKAKIQQYTYVTYFIFSFLMIKKSVMWLLAITCIALPLFSAWWYSLTPKDKTIISNFTTKLERLSLESLERIELKIDKLILKAKKSERFSTLLQEIKEAIENTIIEKTLQTEKTASIWLENMSTSYWHWLIGAETANPQYKRAQIVKMRYKYLDNYNNATNRVLQFNVLSPERTCIYMAPGHVPADFTYTSNDHWKSRDPLPKISWAYFTCDTTNLKVIYPKDYTIFNEGINVWFWSKNQLNPTDQYTYIEPWCVEIVATADNADYVEQKKCFDANMNIPQDNAR